MPWIRTWFRELRGNPGFFAMAVLTLGLASGAGTAVFSIVRGVLLRPLPYREPDRLIRLRIAAEGVRNSISLSAPELKDLRQRTTLFEGLAGFWATPLSLIDEERSTQVMVSPVTANLFPLLGIKPYLGRGFAPGEDAPKAPLLAMLSFELWRTRYGGDPKMINRHITLNDIRFRVIGVTPPKLVLIGRGAPEPVPDVFIAQTWWTDRSLRFLQVIGRLKPGVRLAQAQAELDSVASHLGREYDYSNSGGLGLHAVPLLADHVEPLRSALWALQGAVAFVMLIACSNVASLFAAKLKRREREFAVRSALGASRASLLGRVFIEGLVVSGVAASLGVAVAHVAVKVLRAFHPPSLPRVGDIRVDGAVLAASSGAAVLCGILCALGPVWQAKRLHIAETLRASSRASSGVGGVRFRSSLIIVQVALSIVLVTGAGLLLRTTANLRRIDLGFSPQRILCFDVPIAVQRFATGNSRAEKYLTLARQAGDLPDVETATAVSMAPLRGGFLMAPYSYGPVADTMWGGLSAEYRSILPGYFKTIGARLIAGRDFTSEDCTRGGVAIVDDSLARAAWPNEDPIGRKLYVSADVQSNDHATVRVAGVVHQIRQRHLRGPEPPQVYVPYGYHDDLLNAPLQMTFLLRVAGDPRALRPQVEALVRGAGTGRPVHSFRALNESVNAASSDVRFAVRVMLLFSVLALAFTAAAMYGVVSYLVEQRRYEFGVRLALGARHGQLISLVLKQGLVLGVAGAALGLAGSAVTTRFLDTLLFGVAPIDPPTFFSVTILVCGIAILACLSPALRTASVDPAATIRAE
jgi:putative ABC transport system permease protein